MQVLETSRLILREFIPDDVDALSRVLSDPQMMRFTKGRQSLHGLLRDLVT